MMFWRILRVLMWKHYLTRKKKWYCTIVELVVPIMFFVPSFLIRHEIKNPRMESAKEQELMVWRMEEPASILYTPETNFTRTLMSMVAQKLNMQLLNSLPDKSRDYIMRGYTPFKVNSSVSRYSRTMGPAEAIVVFHNVSDSQPVKLNYSIRMRSPHTDVYSNIHGDLDYIKYHHPEWKDFDYYAINDHFLRLQWTIDSSFIQLLTGKEVKQRVTLRGTLTEYSDWENTVIATYLMSFFLFLACLASLMPIYYGFMARAMAEKASGVQELMEMMGVAPLPLALSHILNACVPGLVFATGVTVLMKVANNAFMEKSNAFLIFMAFFLHFLTILFMGMAFSYIGKKAPNVAVVVMGTYSLLTVPACVAFIMSPMQTHVLNAIGMLITMPICFIIKEISFLEITKEGLQFSNMSSAHFATDISVLRAFVYLLVQILIAIVLCWYLEHVVTGIYGSALPWDFVCQKSFWSKKVPEPNVESHATQAPDSKYFEPAPSNLYAGIRAINVTKDYPKNPGALDNLSLDVYKGEITVLLGHNGAGKSTLIAVITGLTAPSKGKVLVNGYDIMLEKVKARSYIGLCPQQNMFLDHISVIEHVMFFTLIKRGTFAEARKSAEELLDQLNIKDKANNDTSNLSGGMKRRVQLACALAGQAQVLLLDEPTAGLDVETRRSLWDLLLSLRGSRTVLLSTHFMEEADALGDRVAALNAGQLRSHATPMFLKRSLGTGYRLSLETVDKPNEAAITSTVQSVLPNATVKEVTPIGISFNLPIENTMSYPALFSNLESKKSELGIQSISVGVSTLEEVFLKLCSGTDVKLMKEPKIQKGHVSPTLTGFALFRRQFVELVKRYLRFVWRYKYTQIVFGVLVLVGMIFLASLISNNLDQSISNSTMALSGPTEESQILYSDKNNLRLLSDQIPKVRFDNVTNITEAVFERGSEMSTSRYMGAIQISDEDAKVYYKESVLGGAGVALNLLSNVIAARSQPSLKGRTITVNNHPFTDFYPTQSSSTFKISKSKNMCQNWSFIITVVVLVGLTCMMSLPALEYSSGARANHIMAGCSPELHWGTLLLVSIIQVILTYVLAIIISCVALDKDNTFTDGGFLLAMAIYVPLGSMAILVCTYDLTFTMSENFAMGTMSAMIVCGVVLIPILMKVEAISKYYIKLLLKILVPQYAFYELMDEGAAIASLNALCNLNKNHCPDTDILAPEFEGACCGSTSNPVSYFDKHKVGDELIILICLILFYMPRVVLKQRGLDSKLWEMCMVGYYKPPAPKIDDVIIKKEKAYVEETLKRPPREIKDIMLVSDVHKNYVGCCRKFNAVKGVSFSVKKGECFGLLGVNGAGKSTIFQMLTVTHCATKGTIFANTHVPKVPCIMKYMKSLSYCPQFEGLDEFLTGRQNLNLLLALKGLSHKDADAETESWIKLISMEKYIDRCIWEYSGGCKRRMAAAAALCTSAPVTLLDEPTAGVDVAARRSVWSALKRTMQEHRAIIITSHSLDEMEMLCHRIAIMAAGEICALGSPAALKAAYAIGHSVTFNLKHFSKDDETRDQKVNHLKRTIERTFKCNLKDEHGTMLHYHINETMPYSELFKVMEDLKNSSSELIQDYSVSETTLEEVFLSFARLQDPPITKEENKVKFKDVAQKAKDKQSADKKVDGKEDQASSTRDSNPDNDTNGKTDKNKNK